MPASTTIMDGNKVSEELLSRSTTKINNHNLTPELHVIFVGDNDASKSYIKMKQKKANETGIHSAVHHFPEDENFSQIRKKICKLNEQSNVDGIIVQLPLPASLSEIEILETVDPNKDVDGLHPVNFGKLLGGNKPHFYPPTPSGIMKLLDYYNVNLKGQVVTIVGMGRLVGRPLSQMFLNKNSTVVCTNEHTPNLPQKTRKGDIVVAGAGVPELLTEEHISDGTVVVDAGIHQTDDGLVGDVKFDSVSEKSNLITPVPGGVGPLTVAGLLHNTCESAYRRNHS